MKTLKTLTLFVVLLAFLVGCQSLPLRQPSPKEVLIKVQTLNPATISTGEHVSKSMDVKNPNGQLSDMTFLCNNEAYIQLYGGIAVYESRNIGKDMIILKNQFKVTRVHLSLNSPGGSVSDGFALVDEIERAKKNGMEVIIRVSGLVASAAVPILAVGSKRYAAPGTIFMVHEAAIFKYLGFDTIKSLKTQQDMLKLMREIYMNKLASYTKLSVEEWGDKSEKTSWFSAEQAKEWGLVDEIR